MHTFHFNCTIYRNKKSKADELKSDNTSYENERQEMRYESWQKTLKLII